MICILPFSIPNQLTNNYILSRGASGTPKTSHSSGSTVYLLPTPYTNMYGLAPGSDILEESAKSFAQVVHRGNISMMYFDGYTGNFLPDTTLGKTRLLLYLSGHTQLIYCFQL